MKLIASALFLLVLLSQAPAQTATDTTKTRPTLEALRVSNPIVVDGRLTEAEWQRPGATHFLQRDPVEGAEATQKTEVWTAYDDGALYVAARCYDRAPDSITTRLGRKDADISADFFYVGLDSYHDRRTGFYFIVYASGTVADGTLYNDSWDDNSWDGVWDAATNIDDKGWTAEIRIPYSQLRFPMQDEYIWGVNFIRLTERTQERDDFVMVPKKESGWVSRFADLTGLRNINPPRKLEILPYTVSKVQSTNQYESIDPYNKNGHFSGNLGADLKLGLGSNLILNATINPDFGQVEVDPSVVNLSQFETFFQEKRPFFIEGSNFLDFGYGGSNNNWGFNWGNPDYFYSRRVGRAPRGGVQHSGYTDIPDGTRILGAAKITGKLSDSWSLGALNALTAREYARVQDNSGNTYEDVVEPTASYNVVRALRDFNQGRQGLGFLGTATLRDLNQPYLIDAFNHHSYTLGMDGWTNLDSNQLYVLTGWFSTTRVEGTTDRLKSIQQNPLHYFQRPDANHLEVDTGATSLSGYAARMAINKQKGNFYLNAAFGLISPGFDSNDLGFMFRTDLINTHLVLGYHWFEPDGIFRTKRIDIATFRTFTYAGDRTGEGYFVFWSGGLKNYWFVNGSFSYNPATLSNQVTRGGPLMKNTNGYGGDFYLSTDSRDKVVLGMGISSGRTESGGFRLTLDPSVEWKPTSGLSVSISPEINHDVTIAQWVKNRTDATATNTYGARYIFGRLDLQEISSSIRMNWTFTPKLSLQLYLQPLISVGSYTNFKELKQAGTYTFNNYGVDNQSQINRVDHDFRIVLDPGNPTDTTSFYKGDYLVDADGNGPSLPFRIGNPDFNQKFLKLNTILRWEYMPGSTLYFVYTRGGSNFRNAGNYDFRRDFGDLISSPDHDDVFLVKVAYWWNPQ